MLKTITVIVFLFSGILQYSSLLSGILWSQNSEYFLYLFFWYLSVLPGLKPDVIVERLRFTIHSNYPQIGLCIHLPGYPCCPYWPSSSSLSISVSQPVDKV